MEDFHRKEIESVVLEIDDGATVTRIEEKEPEVLRAWYRLNHACEFGTTRDCDDALYVLESVFMEIHGTDCTFDGEVIFKTTTEK